MATEELNQQITERFKQLPKAIQDAIQSADVEKRMRELADTQKLHLDQWNALENEVMLALLGFQPIADLEKNIKSEVGVSDEVAKALTESISKIVFEPIRGELERSLQHPDAKVAEVSSVEAAGKQAIAAETAPSVAPATPPAPAPEQKAERSAVAETYKPGQTSVDRRTVHDDPYRETP